MTPVYLIFGMAHKNFEKKDNTNQLEKTNQDSITENVIITRGNRSQVFNIAKENKQINIKVNRN